MDTILKNSVSLAGEFAVLSQLALRGYDANMTLGNTKGIDILVSNPKNGKMFRLEVKTSYKGNFSNSKMFGHTLNWIMSEKHETIKDTLLYYCFVNIEEQTNIFRFFIIPSIIVADYVRQQHLFWLEHNLHLIGHKNTMRQFRIGLDPDNSKYQLLTPLSKDYENKWNFE